jgi:hypothetical protein
MAGRPFWGCRERANEVMGDARKVIDVCERGCVSFISVTLVVTLFCVKSP